MSMTSTRIRAVTLAAAALAGVASLPALASAPSAATSAGLPNVLPAWAHAQPVSAAAAGSRVAVALQLRGPNDAALASFARSVSLPGSPNYRHFLTPAQFRGRFAPSVAEVAAVRSWLAASGLTVDRVTPYRDVVAAHGTAAVVAKAFDTSFGLFRVDGRLLRAPLRQPTLPTAVAPFVAGVTGLAQVPMRTAASPPPAFTNARPCSSYFAQKKAVGEPKYNGAHQPWAICGYAPAQIRGAYGVNKTHLTGKGVTVAIVDAFASPTIQQDVNTWSKKHGLPTLASGQYSELNGPVVEEMPEDPLGTGLVDPQGWSGEETLDVEAVHEMAPAADVLYVAALTPLNEGLQVAESEAVESGKAQIVSNSWGSAADSPDPADQSLFDHTMSDAASTGVTVSFSSGDDGDEVAASGQRTGDWPATSPQVVAVGGTSLKVTKKNGYGGETYWGTYKSLLAKGKWDLKSSVFYGGGGGGVSSTYPEPSWQKGVVPHSLATYNVTTPGRVEPDISLDADSTTGMLVGQTQTFSDGTTKYSEYRIGGTSVSCPLFAGLMALADQAAGKGLGLVTPTMYGLAAKHKTSRWLRDPAAAKIVRSTGLSAFANVRPDYTDPSNPKSQITVTLRTMGNLGTLHALKGYDDSTGLGSPIAAGFIRAVK
jgi:subtilase family serine protease